MKKNNVVKKMCSSTSLIKLEILSIKDKLFKNLFSVLNFLSLKIEKKEVFMEIEDIAKIDLFLKSKNGLENLMDIENLIISPGTPDAINKLKEGAYKLHNISGPAPQELKETWQNLFTKQVKFSVNRVKNLVNK